MSNAPAHSPILSALLAGTFCTVPASAAATPAATEDAVRYDRDAPRIRTRDARTENLRRVRAVAEREAKQGPTMTAADFVREKRTEEELAARMAIIDAQIEILLRLIRSHVGERGTGFRI